jgi:hypothetical protein
VSRKAVLIAVAVLVVCAAVLSTAFFNGVGRGADRSAGLRTEAEAEHRRLESGFRRAAATIDEIEDGLGRIGAIASEIDRDNGGAVGAIRAAIEIVERVRVEVAVMEGCIADFRDNDGSGAGDGNN